MKNVVFSKRLLLVWDFFNRHIAVFFKASVLKEVRILCYFHNNSPVLIPKFQNKANLYYIYTWQILEADLFCGNVFYTLYFFYCCSLFYMSFFENLKTSMNACFYNRNFYTCYITKLHNKIKYIEKLRSVVTHILMGD